MKSVNKKKIIASTVFVVLFGLTQLFCALRVQALERSLPNAAVLQSPRGIGITMKQAVSFGSMTKMAAGVMSAWQNQAVSIATGATEPAYTAFATPSSGFCLPYQYTYGNWFLPGNDIAPYAVLPESLSISLFGTNQPEGCAIVVGETEYRICGVYREEQGFLHEISGDGLPRVYLFDPLHMADVPAAAVYLTDSKGGDAQYLAQQASGVQKTVLTGSLTDYRARLELAGSLWYLSVLVCALFTAVLLLHAAGRQLIAAASRQKETAEKRLLRLFIGAGATVVVWFGLSTLLSRLIIPPSYLPQDNIFELSFYAKSIETFFTAFYRSGGATHYESIFLTQILALLFWAILGCVFFMIGALKIRNCLIKAR